MTTCRNVTLGRRRSGRRWQKVSKDSGHEMYCTILSIIETYKRWDMRILANIKELFLGNPAIC